MRAVIHVELVKLLALWRVRLVLLLALLALLAPPAVLAVLQLQSGLPTDTLYGRWVQDIGLAFPLVLLGSAGVWAIPVLASLVAGDLLSSEDAHGTWPTLMTRSRRLHHLFWGKALVAGLTTVTLVTVLAASSLLSGVLIVGTQDLVGLSGQPVAFGSGARLVLLAWLSALPTAVAVSAGALLVSAATRSSLLGVAVPSAVAGALGLLGLLAPLGSLRPLLITPGLTAWHDLLLEDPAVGDVVLSTVASLCCAALLLAAGAAVIRRREWAAA